MAERFTNDFEVALTASVASASTGDAAVLHVTAVAPTALQDGTFRVRIDDEILTVISGQDTLTWVGFRGQEGTSAAAHANAATVTHVLTAASLSAGYVGIVDNTAEGINWITNAAWLHSHDSGGTGYLVTDDVGTFATLDTTYGAGAGVVGSGDPYAYMYPWGLFEASVANLDDAVFHGSNATNQMRIYPTHLSFDGTDLTGLGSGKMGIAEYTDTPREIVTVHPDAFLSGEVGAGIRLPVSNWLVFQDGDGVGSYTGVGHESIDMYDAVGAAAYASATYGYSHSTGSYSHSVEMRVIDGKPGVYLDSSAMIVDPVLGPEFRFDQPVIVEDRPVVTINPDVYSDGDPLDYGVGIRLPLEGAIVFADNGYYDGDGVYASFGGPTGFENELPHFDLWDGSAETYANPGVLWTFRTGQGSLGLDPSTGVTFIGTDGPGGITHLTRPGAGRLAINGYDIAVINGGIVIPNDDGTITKTLRLSHDGATLEIV